MNSNSTSAMSGLAAATETALVNRAIGGEHAAFEQIVREHGDGVYTLLARRCGQQALADDAFQETFVRAWRRLQSFDPSRGNLRAWLLGIAGKCAIEELRRREHCAATMVSERTSGPALAGASAFEPSFTGIWTVVDRALSREAASAVWLRYGEGLTNEQVGAVLGRSSVGVRMMLMRARRTLRELIAAQPTLIGQEHNTEGQSFSTKTRRVEMTDGTAFGMGVAGERA